MKFMIGNLKRLAAVGVGVTALLGASALPAQAAATEGRETITTDRCFTDEEINLTFCVTGTERRIEVRTPSGVVVMQGESEYLSTTTHRGETTTQTSSGKYVSVFAWWLDGLNFDPNVIKIDGTSTMTFPDGTTCIFVDDSISANDIDRYNHGSVTCTTP
jgi:hypothetical protein